VFILWKWTFVRFRLFHRLAIFFSTITRTLPFSFRLFHRYANFLFFFHYNTDFAIFDYLRDWFFEDLSVPHNDHPWDHKLMVVVDRWSLLRGNLYSKIPIWDHKNGVRYRQLVVSSGLTVKALHSELLTKLSSRFLSRNEFFGISEVRVERHFFVLFGKFGISEFPKFPNFSELFDPKTGFFPLDFKFYVVFSKILKFM